MTLRSLPLPLKVLSSCYLITAGVGYLFAIAYLYLLDFNPHNQPRVSAVQAVIEKYYGKREETQLESAVKGTMAEHVTSTEQAQILQWIRQGAAEANFAAIQPIVQKSCATCHSAESGLPIPPLASYADISKYVAEDLGKSFQSLVRVSHIHLFGMSFIFMFTSVIFAFSEKPVLFKSLLIAIPFFAIWLDIGSWWFTKFRPVFAYTVIAGGALMGLSLGTQIMLSLYEMWLGNDSSNKE
jgi:hypothetical protein